MRYSFLIAIVSLTGSAAAQPANPQLVEVRPCAVTIVRAPDDARREIEDWVAREVSCRIALDVRVIPTDGGLYLLARESTGKLHERLVPDAQSAGVLVASWIANDSLEPPPPPPLTPPPPALLLPGPMPFVEPPGDMILRVPAPCRGMACGNPRRRGAWGIGVTLFPTETSGARLRGDIDVVRVGGFAAGLVMAGGSTTNNYMYSYLYGYASPARRLDGRVLGGVSWTLRQGAFNARLQAAAGAVWSHILKDESVGVYARNWSAFAFEASVLLGYQVSDEWSVGIAPVVTKYNETATHDYEASLGTNDVGVLLELRRGP